MKKPEESSRCAHTVTQSRHQVQPLGANAEVRRRGGRSQDEGRAVVCARSDRPTDRNMVDKF